MAGDCAFIERIEVGKRTVKITDPLALIEAAKKKQVTRVVKSSLWDIYEYPPVLVELAKQNGMSVEDMIILLEDSWKDDIFNPFRALLELPDSIRALEQVVGPERADQVVEDIMQLIIKDLNLEISRGIGI